ncbi:MAG: prepilin-type N-terminal cleavage/methylation domain-containing protein [Trueperaceae bacterium]|nr:prepilin-type N-terminal cleavage/methylation domain-containing protein [Trueperaceae bacterium]MCO5174272.1 prepilin-type N-terminal cleavage/methylation domain-containing protein [Trueperaceae bacterium]MCW5819786.1 prepilin-type N-terminal cleavage/methylation domain-containing protein [Trueperaceae bacterium]
MRSVRQPERTKGLTLVEVLIALMIITVVVAASVPIIISSMQSSADNRIRAQAVAATEVWLDRFRAKSLDFSTFSAGVDYPYDYDFGADPTFVAAADPNPAALNAEWQPFSYSVRTTTFTTDPLIWRVDVATTYRRTNQAEGTFDVSTLIEQ